MKIKPTETTIDSAWGINSHNLTREEGVESTLRIYWLTGNYLKEISTLGSETLYRDPKDHRYWELTYPQYEYHGGGPPLLRYLTDEEAVDKYHVKPK
ncbi:MAG: immunity 27 family protein [Rikenellaceae bacterium]|jgi:hypothetical protein|nr:immunity 27 family protein [Rikenellaceae bacterium]